MIPDGLRNANERTRPVKKTYKVIGSRQVAGYSKGEEFQGEFSDSQELSLIQAGHIEVVKPKAETPKVAAKKAVGKVADHGKADS